MSQVFDPTLFLEVTVDSPFEDRIPLPIGEYTAMIGQIAARSWAPSAGPDPIPTTLFRSPST